MNVSKTNYARHAGRKKPKMNRLNLPPAELSLQRSSRPKERPMRPSLSEPGYYDQAREDCPVLRFTPYAWAKLLYFRDAGGTEIGGFGVSGITTNDLLLVEDFVTLQQAVTAVTVAFDDTAVADYFDEQVMLSRRPEQFGRIWIHTHPGTSPQPSMTDEATFDRVFGSCSWAVMSILAKEGATYCRLRFNAGPGGALALRTAVDFAGEFPPADHAAWQAEYDQNVQFPAPTGAFEPDAFLVKDLDSFFASRRHRVRDDERDQEDIHEALFEEYMAYWGEDRAVFE
jgi:hypothetical protein